MESGRIAMGEMGRLLCDEGRRSGERPDEDEIASCTCYLR